MQNLSVIEVYLEAAHVDLVLPFDYNRDCFSFIEVGITPDTKFT